MPWATPARRFSLASTTQGVSLVRKAVIAGNWKMHMNCAEARAFAQSFRGQVENLPEDRQVVIAPPYTSASTKTIRLI